jgi:hypothetical protein
MKLCEAREYQTKIGDEGMYQYYGTGDGTLTRDIKDAIVVQAEDSQTRVRMFAVLDWLCDTTGG